MKSAILQKIEEEQKKTDIPEFRVGDTIRVHIRIIEGAKERIQMFQGTVIARSGEGFNETFSVHRVAYDEGMERVFLLHSPRIAKIEVLRQGDVRQAKLYYLRGTSGKKAKVKGKIIRKKQKVAEVVTAPVETPEPVEEVSTESKEEVTAPETQTETEK